MRFLYALLATVTLAWPAYADTILLQEDFEAPAGKLVDGWNGWVGNGGVVISKTAIAQGMSVTWNGSVKWPFASKSFSYMPHAGEQYELVATLSVVNVAGDPTGGYADVRLSSSNDTASKHVAAQIDKGVLGFEQNAEYYEPNGDFSKNYIHVAQTAATIDVRLLISDRHVQCYYRDHGVPKWEFAGTLYARNPLTTYKTLTIGGRRVGGNVDSMQLKARSDEAGK
jgi:hypothetical protein